MKYFLPDSQDLVDPSFDFERERRSVTRLRQRDDLYAHELFKEAPFDGILVSKGIVDGSESATGKYTLAQRHRLLREGARAFFRLDRAGKASLPTMGDCGAFTYVKDKAPPYKVDDVLQFYVECGFDYGISVDHVILAYNPQWDEPGMKAPVEVRERQDITLELAHEFLARCKRDELALKPLGVAQGWSPGSYVRGVQALEKMGYRYIAVGGMVPLKTPEIVQVMQALGAVRKKDTRFHLLGVTRTGEIPQFARMGVESFDSTSPLRQAFKDDKDNYYTMDRNYVAVRVPQIEGNPKLQKMISSGKVAQNKARELERACLEGLRQLDAGHRSVADMLGDLQRYDEHCMGSDAEPSTVATKYRELYREVLTDRPWKACPCEVCRALGHHVILFRGAERNRRRGFHNTWVFYRKLAREVGHTSPESQEPAAARSHRAVAEVCT